MFIAILLGLQASAAALPEITIRTTSDGYRAEAADFPASQQAAVYDEISRRADKICVGKQIKWGRFGSSAEVRIERSLSTPGINGYFKEFRCVVEKQRAFSAAPADWKSDPADEADVRRIFESYYRKRDAGDFAAATAMWQPEQQSDRSADDVGEFNKRLGGGSRRITGVTWYVNPPSAEIPGVYAALDFVGDYPKLTSIAATSSCIGVDRANMRSHEKSRTLSSAARDPLI